MKLSKIFMISFLIVSLAGALAFGGYSSYTYNNVLTEKVYEHLNSLAESKIELAESFLEAKKARAIDFSSDGFIKNSMVKLNDEPGSIQVMEDLSNHLTVNKLPLEEDFYEVMVLDVNGKVVATTDPEEAFGADFSDNHMFLMGKKQPHLMEVFYDEGFRHKGIALSAPILVDNEVLGVVVIKLLPDSFYEITSRRIEFGETEDVYIVNKEKYLITPSRFLKGEGGVLVQKVDTENVRQCFDEDVIGHAERDEPVISFLDYRGEEVIGTHREVTETQWCLLAEINKQEALDAPLRGLIWNQVIVSVFVVMISTLAGFFVGRFLDRNYTLKKKGGGNVSKK